MRGQTAATSWVLAGVLLALVLGAWLMFEFGRMQAGYNVLDAAAERRAYRQRVGDLSREITDLREKIAVLETHRDIDRAAYREVETSLGELQATIQEQRDEIAFYRGIISPADGERGLRVQDLKLRKGSEEGQYFIRLVLVQALQHDTEVRGNVELSLEGDQDGELTVYTMEQLVPASEDGDWPFSFRYFQNFDRQLMLPEGFSPEKVHIEIRSRTSSVTGVSQSFLWDTGQG